jgi:hypothetical protein
MVINLLLMLSAVGVAAQGPAPTGSVEAPAAALGTAFTYQGRLRNSGNPVNGACDFQFSLWDALNGGTQIGATRVVNNALVNEGRFTVQLDFGAGAFNGDARWLALAVRCPAGSGAFTTIAPRQPFTSAPYALRATSAGSVPWSGITNIPAGFADGVDNGGTVPLILTGISNAAVVAATNTNPNDVTEGVYGESNSSAGNGVHGVANAGANGFGVWGEAATGSGTVGSSTAGNGVLGVQGGGGPGSNVPVGVLGTSADFLGVFGLSTNNRGVEAYSKNDIGLYSATGNNGSYAGYFSGRVHVNGTLSKSAGSFKIDHPLDPANKYLSHSFVESPDMMNIYNGNVTLDKQGEAVVELPAWFEALNQEFRYQLTAIGAPGPNLYVAVEIKGNRFTIAGGKPGMKVSWQVTGIRHDPYANQNRIPVEENKPADERGTYLYPQGYGQPATKGIDYVSRSSAGQSRLKVPARSKTP